MTVSYDILHFSIKEAGVYGVSKTGLLGLTKVLSIELAPYKIRVNCISPGLIETKFGSVVSINKAL